MATSRVYSKKNNWEKRSLALQVCPTKSWVPEHDGQSKTPQDTCCEHVLRERTKPPLFLVTEHWELLDMEHNNPVHLHFTENNKRQRPSFKGKEKFSAIPRSGLGAEKGYTTTSPTTIGSAPLLTHYHFSDVEILLLVLLCKGCERADSSISITHTALLPPLDLCPSLPSCHKLGSLEMNTLMEFCGNIFVRDQHL